MSESSNAVDPCKADAVGIQVEQTQVQDHILAGGQALEKYLSEICDAFLRAAMRLVALRTVFPLVENTYEETIYEMSLLNFVSLAFHSGCFVQNPKLLLHGTEDESGVVIHSVPDVPTETLVVFVRKDGELKYCLLCSDGPQYWQINKESFVAQVMNMEGAVDVANSLNIVQQSCHERIDEIIRMVSGICIVNWNKIQFEVVSQSMQCFTAIGCGGNHEVVRNMMHRVVVMTHHFLFLHSCCCINGELLGQSFLERVQYEYNALADMHIHW